MSSEQKSETNPFKEKLTQAMITHTNVHIVNGERHEETIQIPAHAVFMINSSGPIEPIDRAIFDRLYHVTFPEDDHDRGDRKARVDGS